MKLFKWLRFYLVWALAVPFVFLYLVGAAIGSGQWLLIWIKFQLIHQSLRQKFISIKFYKI